MVTFTAEENGFVIEADGKKLWVSYDEFHGKYKSVMKFCQKQGGGDETVENLRFIARRRDAINEELKKLGKEIIMGWYWANEIAWRSDGCVFVVNTFNGNTTNITRNNYNRARAIATL